MKRISPPPVSSLNSAAVPRRARATISASRRASSLASPGTASDAVGERGADHDHVGYLPAAEDDLRRLARGVAQPLALELVGRPAMAFGHDTLVRRRRRVRERELSELREQPAEERLLDQRAIHRACERAGDDRVHKAAVPVDAEVEARRDAPARKLVREREPERHDLERAHAEHHRRAAERRHLAATVVEGRVRDAQDTSASIGSRAITSARSPISASGSWQTRRTSSAAAGRLGSVLSSWRADRSVAAR